ncbi:putative E3 ubiquitin-protein ligase UNKL [Armadillidium vulgare]|nr:putative E3 ubiquitin-protein ligase UNKL [Armadillidium vulgare]
MCPYVRDNMPCPGGEYCNLCHSQIERVFHPKNYKSNVCLDWYDLKRCPRKGFCAKSHPMNPDSFFSEAWKDVFVAGLDQSYFFFSGAIKQLYKVPDNEGGIPIMFITTLPEVARLTAEVAKPVARIHRLKIAIITDESQDPGVSFYEKFSRKKVVCIFISPNKVRIYM